jgi:hypothetical protein
MPVSGQCDRKREDCPNTVMQKRCDVEIVGCRGAACRGGAPASRCSGESAMAAPSHRPWVGPAVASRVVQNPSPERAREIFVVDEKDRRRRSKELRRCRSDEVYSKKIRAQLGGVLHSPARSGFISHSTCTRFFPAISSSVRLRRRSLLRLRRSSSTSR